jgi:hypothetical protein
MPCPANVLGYLLTIRLFLTGAPHVQFGKLPHSHSGRRAAKRSVIPSGVSRAFVFARSAEHQKGLPGRRLVEPGRFVEESLFALESSVGIIFSPERLPLPV